MDESFHPAIAAVNAGDLEQFKSLVAADPSLATSRSSKSHPTLLQWVVLDGKDKPNNVEMAEVLVDAGASVVAELLLDRGAAIDGQNLRTAACWRKVLRST